MTADEAAVLQILRCRDHASHTLEQISNAADMNRRDVEVALMGLRRFGVPILGDGKGMRIAHSRAEALAAYRSLRRRALRAYLARVNDEQP